MGESTLRWPTDKEREEKEEVCSIGYDGRMTGDPHRTRRRDEWHWRALAVDAVPSLIDWSAKKSGADWGYK